MNLEIKKPYIPTQNRKKMISLAWKYRKLYRKNKTEDIHYLMVSRGILRAVPKKTIDKKINVLDYEKILCQ
jgi:hypothetical protein